MWIRALLFVVALGRVVPLAAAADDDTAARIRAIVRELDAPQRATRDAAEKQLLEFGSDALPHLTTLPSGSSPEAVMRVERVRTELYRRRTAASLDASTVTLDVADAPLDGVLAEFEKQTGNKLVDFRRQFGQQAGAIRVTLALDKTPFWKALDALTSVAGLQVYHFAGGDGLALVERSADARSGPREGSTLAYSGAFRLALRRLVAAREPTDPAQGELQIEWEVAWEPRLKPLFFTAAASKLQAVYGAGEAAAPRNRDQVLEIPPPGKACRIDVATAFHAPPRSAPALTSFGGVIDVLIPAEMRTFRFDRLDSDRRREQRAGAVTVSIEEPRGDDRAVVVVLRLRYENAANALESHRGWFYKNGCYLESADGTQTKPAAVELVRQADNELTLGLTFEPATNWRPQTLVYQTPADLVVLPIEFQFHDLPLP